MADHEARAFYDHEIEGDRLDGGRRRPVADWGVGEELFDRMPSRRRLRSGDGGAARRDVHAGDSGVARRDVHAGERRFAGAEAEHEVRGDARRGRVSDTRRPAPRETPPAEAPREVVAHDAATAELPLVPEASPMEPAPARPAEIEAMTAPAEGRRTVVIRGRGAEPAAMARRSRPPRTVGERLGPRPDRVAAWAVALGVLLILIAILTAH